MRVLITGSAGFLGSHIAERLTEAGHRVVGVDNLLTGRLDNWPDTRQVDITDRHDFYSVANKLTPDLVVHCAASYSDPNLWHRDADTNVAGTINAVLTARHHGARLFYFQTALPPISSYAISKIAGEHYIRLADDVPSLTFRLANVYGPRNVSGPIPAFWKRLKAGERCTVMRTTRELVYVDDLVDAVMLALDEDVRGRIDFCSGQPVSILSVYEAVREALGVDGYHDVLEPDTDDVTQMELDPDAAQVRLGWTASTPLTEGVADAVEWYEQHGLAETYTHLRRG